MTPGISYLDATTPAIRTRLVILAHHLAAYEHNSSHITIQMSTSMMRKVHFPE
jgi:hypothetical protein